MPFPPDAPTPTFPYQVEARIGEGAMGIVYRAVEPVLDRPVAIKTLKAQALSAETPDVAREYRLRFLQEAKAAAALSHPGATTIYRTGEEDGVPYIAMEWLEGKTLEQLLREEGVLPPSRAALLIIDLLGTLEAAHVAGVVHRDIKPANLVLLRDGRLKVTDFGIARLRGSELVKTQAGFVLATPRFASPEQLRAEEVDGRSDLFSVGILFYQAVTGRFPFGGDDFLQVATAIFRDEPPPVRSLNPAVPAELAAVIETALRKDREVRWQSAREMSEALSAALSAAAARVSPTDETRAALLGSNAPGVPGAAAAEKSAVLRGVPAGERWRAAVAAARSWPAKDLGVQTSKTLLERLLDRPLHAAPFAGAVFFEQTCLFLADGLILGAVDCKSGETGDGVVEALPALAPAALRPAPIGDSGAGSLVRVLASLLRPPRLRHQQLDSSFVSLQALGAKLREEGFDGALRLRRRRLAAGSTAGDGAGIILFCGGSPAVALFDGGWGDVPVDRPWEEWISAVACHADIEESHAVPGFLSFRRELRNAAVAVSPSSAAPPAGTERRRSGASLRMPAVLLTPSQSPSGGDPALLPDDPIHRFLRWALTDLPEFFRERDKTARWKYLVEWLADVRTARLHHDLPRPGSLETDFFDLATFDSGGRVLHLGERVTRGTGAALDEARNRMIRAKTARLKTGDVGGAFLIARSFDDDALAAYRAGDPGTASGGRWTFGFEESFTGYEGFVRVGPRRGFHLLLVEETDDGFVPILPG
jgi:tRNA A-37 threonylcarbamoyl transferase component Bud32